MLLLIVWVMSGWLRRNSSSFPVPHIHYTAKAAALRGPVSHYFHSKTLASQQKHSFRQRNPSVWLTTQFMFIIILLPLFSASMKKEKKKVRTKSPWIELCYDIYQLTNYPVWGYRCVLLGTMTQNSNSQSKDYELDYHFRSNVPLIYLYLLLLY